MADENPVDTGGGGDVVITDKQLYDHAISDAKPEPAAPAAAPEPTPAQQEPAAPQRARDDQGRFAPRTGQQPPPQQPQAAPQPPPQRMPEDHRVPLRELLDERERRQRIEAEATQMREAWAQLQRQADQLTAQQQQPQTIFDNPDDYLQNRVMNPLREEGQRYMMQIKDGLSREMANNQFGVQAVNQALTDLTAVRYTPHGNVIFSQIMSSGHPYGELIKWHQQASAQRVIGNDPNAWLRQQQEQWISDPRVQDEAMRRRAARVQQNGANRPPNVQLPPSLSSMPASSSRIDEQGDLSNESLYRFATK